MTQKNGQIKEIFERLYGHIKPDEKLARQLRDFRIAFMTKNPEHMAFFGGNLTGVQIVRFTPKDQDMFFSDICQVDQYELEEELHKTDNIKAEWKVAGNAFNHMCMWLIHLYCSSDLNEKAKHAAMMEAALILYYRFITSVLFRFFPYPVDPSLAEAVYANLSNKFSIKQFGSWQAVLESRCEKLIDKSSIHYRTLLNYNNDIDIVRMINDSQGRTKDMIKNIYSVFDKVRKSGLKVRSSSMLLEHEGDFILKDKTKGLQRYTQYMHSIVTDQNSFVKAEIIDILKRIVNTAPPSLVEQTLIWCSKNYDYASKDIVKEFIDKTLLHSFAYLEDNRTVYKTSGDLPVLISKLKGVYSSSRSTDKLLLEIRSLAETITRSTGLTKNSVTIASVRNALLLYVVIRAFTMNYFSKTG